MLERFRDARDEDYTTIASEVRKASKRLPSKLAADDDRRSKVQSDVERFERRLEEIAAIDFFHAPGRETAVGLVAGLRSRLEDTPHEDAREGVPGPTASYRGRVWVTRTGVHVDRIASAWLVKRFIDPEATFKFVPAKGYVPEPGELRFDMFDAEFTHEGDRCTFEVLVIGLCTIHREDEARLTAGFALFDQLKAHFSRKRS